VNQPTFDFGNAAARNHPTPPLQRIGQIALRQVLLIAELADLSAD
jgi:hypothetical protein